MSEEKSPSRRCPTFNPGLKISSLIKSRLLLPISTNIHDLDIVVHLEKTDKNMFLYSNVSSINACVYENSAVY